MLKKFITLIVVLLSSLSQAKPKAEQLPQLGKQLVELYLRGAELQPKNKVKSPKCWDDNMKAAPNLEILSNDLAEGEEDLKMPFYQLGSNDKIVFQNLVLNDTQLKTIAGKNLIDYNAFGTFSYLFKVKTPKGYLKCLGYLKSPDTQYCQNFAANKSETNATIFAVHGRVIPPTKEQAKSRGLKGKNKWLVTPTGLGQKLGLVRKNCYKK